MEHAAHISFLYPQLGHTTLYLKNIYKNITYLLVSGSVEVVGQQNQHEPVADATTPIYEIHLIPNVQPIEGAVLCRSVLNKRKHELTARNRFPREETPDRAHSGWLDDAARTSADRAGTTAADGTRKPNRSAPPKR